MTGSLDPEGKGAPCQNPCEDALTSAHEIEPSNPDIAAALKQLKKNMEDYKTRRRSSPAHRSSFNCRGCSYLVESIFHDAGDVAKEMLSGKEQAPDVAEQAPGREVFVPSNVCSRVIPVIVRLASSGRFWASGCSPGFGKRGFCEQCLPECTCIPIP